LNKIKAGGTFLMTKLEIKDVFYRYKHASRDVLKGVSCVLSGGSFNAIVGPSGSGKSTLLSIMAGLDRPSSGEIAIDGNDLEKLNLDKYRREAIAIIFQAFQLFSLLTALENVCYSMELNGMSKKDAKERATQLLESVGIACEKHNRYPSNLSGGEQQRVAIARALAGGGKVILADEPTGNLDEENSKHIIEILQNLAHKAGYCVIIVTHDLDIASKADKVFRMKDGYLSEGV